MEWKGREQIGVEWKGREQDETKRMEQSGMQQN
jgi:hypothetical protein